VTEPETKYPQTFRVSASADRRLPWRLISSAELMYSRDVNGWYTTDANLSSMGTDGNDHDHRHCLASLRLRRWPRVQPGLGLALHWTVNGDVNADGINGNDVVFVPANASQISLMDPAQYDALATCINSQDCLKGAKGHFIKRGACRNPWTEFLNVRGTWQSPQVMGQRFEVQLDFFNVLNLVHNKWGLIDQAASFENANSTFLRAVGYDAAAGRPIYTFAAPASVVNPVHSPTSSRWRIQLGARYRF
jgi:hypothetical protein